MTTQCSDTWDTLPSTAYSAVMSPVSRTMVGSIVLGEAAPSRLRRNCTMQFWPTFAANRLGPSAAAGLAPSLLPLPAATKISAAPAVKAKSTGRFMAHLIDALKNWANLFVLPAWGQGGGGQFQRLVGSPKCFALSRQALRSHHLGTGLHGQRQREQSDVTQGPSSQNPSPGNDRDDRATATADRDAYTQRDKDHQKGH